MSDAESSEPISFTQFSEVGLVVLTAAVWVMEIGRLPEPVMILVVFATLWSLFIMVSWYHRFTRGVADAE